MPIVAKRVLEERRLAREAQALTMEQVRTETTAPASPRVEPPAPVEQAASSAEPEKPKKAKREKKPDRPKKQPTGDYKNGYCRPPVEHQFDGSKPGPGRPKGAVGQDTIARKHLEKRRKITVEGKAITVTHRELIYMQLINTAIAGKDRRSIRDALSDAERLFPERHASETGEAGGPELTDTGRAILDLFAEEIREEERNKGRQT